MNKAQEIAAMELIAEIDQMGRRLAAMKKIVATTMLPQTKKKPVKRMSREEFKAMIAKGGRQ